MRARPLPPSGDDWRPTPPEIDHAPELALLAVLDHALDILAAAVVAAHPNLTDDEPFYRQLHRPEVKAADVILTHARRLRVALGRYRRAIAELHAETVNEQDSPGGLDEIPF
jgi:hypothetical protein